MRTSILITALLPLAFASPLADNAAKVLSGLQSEYKDGEAINSAFNAIGSDSTKPSSKQFTAIAKQTAALNKAIQATTKLASSSSTFTAAESQSIGNYVNNTLAPATISILQNVINHCPGFQSAGYAGATGTNLKQQEGLVSSQGKAIAAKLTQPYSGESGPVIQSILNQYATAVSTYNSGSCTSS